VAGQNFTVFVIDNAAKNPLFDTIDALLPFIYALLAGRPV
jgi:hypothetical protein